MASSARQTQTVRVTDTRALKALAHPTRNAILEHLQIHGPATATECASVVGMSPSACSYHLRLLERYGFVQTDRDEDRIDGRERPWKAVVSAWSAESGADTNPQQMQAIDMALARVLLSSSDQRVLSWVDQSGQDSQQWRAASLISNSTIAATANELLRLQATIQAAIAPYLIHERGLKDLDPNARLVHAAVRLTPMAPPRVQDSLG
jgi:predicted ArsR family transcriptional regulator